MKTWFDYFDTDPLERIGRYVEDSLGTQRIVELHRLDWAYMDWLAEVEGCDTALFFKENDAVYRPEDGDYNEFIIGCVKAGFLWREKRGLPRPEWCPPAGWGELQVFDLGE